MKKAILIGNNTIAVKCLEILEKNRVEISAVVPDPSDEGKDSWQLSLKRAAYQKGLKVILAKKFDSDFASEIKRLSPDIMFSVQCRQILKKNVISIPNMGVINLHFALLPKYRGCYPVAWAILNGETETGVTLHYIDEGVDTGDIISQTPIEIRKENTARDIFDKCTAVGSELFSKELPEILRKKNKREKQNDLEALYYPKGSLDFNENRIDWNSDFSYLFNWIRAYIFPPHQMPYFVFGENGIAVSRLSSFNNINPGNPGEVARIDENGIWVSAKNGNVVLSELLIGGRTFKAKDFAKQNGIEKGTFFE